MSQSGEKEKRTLITLTQDFLNVLTSSEGKEVDLSQLENDLGVSKRRLYDVTNVLAGIGIIERSGKAKVKWIGSGNDEQNEQLMSQIKEKEKEVDEMLSFVDNQLEQIYSSPEMQQYGWVTKDDILTLSQKMNVSMFSLIGPSDLTILYPDDDEGTNRLICTSEKGGIELVHVNPNDNVLKNGY